MLTLLVWNAFNSVLHFNDNIRFIPQNDEHLTINSTVVRVTTVFVDLDTLSEFYTIIPFVCHREHKLCLS